MGVTTRSLGRVEIVPPLNQAEHDHLRAVATGCARLVAPDGLEPGCPWEPCPHGCCLRWDGSDSHGTGAEGSQLLIDRSLAPDDPGGPVDSLDDPQLAGLTSDHRTNGVIAGEEGGQGSFLLRVVDGRVRAEMLVDEDRAPRERRLGPRGSCRGARPGPARTSGADGSTR